jgi:hypothetical protein
MSDKHKCFISYHEADRDEVETLIEDSEDAFIDKIVGAFDYEPVASEDEEYIKRVIREDYLTDSTVTIVMVGKCTWARKFVDWEIASTLRNDEKNKRSGLMGITLPSVASDDSRRCPARLEANRGKPGDDSKYARWYVYPSSVASLIDCIEDAYQARDDRAGVVDNSLALMTANKSCS